MPSARVPVARNPASRARGYAFAVRDVPLIASRECVLDKRDKSAPRGLVSRVLFSGRQRHERAGRFHQLNRTVRQRSAEACPMMTGDEVDRGRPGAAVLATQAVQQLYEERIAVCQAGKPDRQHGRPVATLWRLATQFEAAIGPIRQTMLMQVEGRRMHLRTL